MSQDKTALEYFTQTLDVILESDNVQDLCKRIVHSELTMGQVRGAHLYTLDSKLKLGKLASYGQAFNEPEDFSIWTQSAVGESFKVKSFVTEKGTPETDGFPIAAMPFIGQGGPVGVLVLVLEENMTSFTFTQDNFIALSRLGALYLQSRMVTAATGPANRGGSVEDITPRQIKILEFAAQGMTNAEIGTQVLLSESTVRQETIKIYRSLGVANRQEAIIQGKSIGLIQDQKFLATA